MTATSTDEDEAADEETSPEKMPSTPRGTKIKWEVETKYILLAMKKY